MIIQMDILEAEQEDNYFDRFQTTLDFEQWLRET